MTGRTSTGFSVFLLCAQLLAGCTPDTEHSAGIPTEDEILVWAQAIHEAATTIDTHNDILGNWGTPEIDPCTGTDVPWRFSDSGGIEFYFPLYTTMSSGQRLLLVRSLGAFNSEFPGAPGVKFEWTDGKLVHLDGHRSTGGYDDGIR